MSRAVCECKCECLRFKHNNNNGTFFVFLMCITNLVCNKRSVAFVYCFVFRWLSMALHQDAFRSGWNATHTHTQINTFFIPKAIFNIVQLIFSICWANKSSQLFKCIDNSENRREIFSRKVLWPCARCAAATTCIKRLPFEVCIYSILFWHLLNLC